VGAAVCGVASKIEKLARKIGLNKTDSYYYFPNALNKRDTTYVLTSSP